MEILQFRQISRAELLWEFALLGALDCEVHPGQINGDDQGQQHETTGPYTGEIIHDPKRDRHEKPAQTADQTDHAPDRSDMIGVVDRNMFVDGRLAQRHHESK